MHVLLSFEGRGVMHLLGFYSQSLKRGTRSLCLWALQDQRGFFGFSTDTVWGLYVPACRMPAPFTHLNVSDLENFLWSFDLFWFSFEAAIYAHFPGPKCSCSNIYFADLPARNVLTSKPASQGSLSPWAKASADECQHWHQERRSFKSNLCCVQEYNTMPWITQT